MKALDITWKELIMDCEHDFSSPDPLNQERQMCSKGCGYVYTPPKDIRGIDADALRKWLEKNDGCYPDGFCIGHVIKPLLDCLAPKEECGIDMSCPMHKNGGSICICGDTPPPKDQVEECEHGEYWFDCTPCAIGKVDSLKADNKVMRDALQFISGSPKNGNPHKAQAFQSIAKQALSSLNEDV